MTYYLIALGGVTLFYAILLRRMQRRLRQARADLRWEQVKRNQSREFVATAEVALQAMAERHHEAECVIAGIDIPKSIWIDGERIPVADADDDDLELGQPLLQEFPRTDSARPMQGGYDWKQEMP